MSHTFKDKPSKFKYDAWDKDRVMLRDDCNYICLQLPTTKPKKRKEVDTEDHWMTTPSWWNNLSHTRPMRGNFRTFLSTAKKSKLEDIEEMLEPTDSRSPHIYFW